MKMRTHIWHVGMLNGAASFIQYAILHSILRLLDAIGMRAAILDSVRLYSVVFGSLRKFMATIDVCNGGVIDFWEDKKLIKFIGKLVLKECRNVAPYKGCFMVVFNVFWLCHSLIVYL